MKKLSRDFKGVWIPKEIWLADHLTITEKVFLVEIDSLDNKDGCYATNKHFQAFSGLSVGRCSQVIKKLEDKGLISCSYTKDADNNKRRVIRVINKLNTGVFRKLKGGILETKEGYLENAECSNTKSSNTKSSINNNEQTQGSSSLKSDFEKLWSLYPRKEGKKPAFAAYKRAIKKGTTNKDIQNGIINYKKQIKIQGTTKNYIKQGSTWFNQECWNDEPNFTPPPKKRNGRDVVQKEALPDWAKSNYQNDQPKKDDKSKAELNASIQRRLAEIKKS